MEILVGTYYDDAFIFHLFYLKHASNLITCSRINLIVSFVVSVFFGDPPSFLVWIFRLATFFDGITLAFWWSKASGLMTLIEIERWLLFPFLNTPDRMETFVPLRLCFEFCQCWAARAWAWARKMGDESDCHMLEM